MSYKKLSDWIDISWLFFCFILSILLINQAITIDPIIVSALYALAKIHWSQIDILNELKKSNQSPS